MFELYSQLFARQDLMRAVNVQLQFEVVPFSAPSPGICLHVPSDPVYQTYWELVVSLTESLCYADLV